LWFVTPALLFLTIEGHMVEIIKDGSAAMIEVN